MQNQLTTYLLQTQIYFRVSTMKMKIYTAFSGRVVLSASLKPVCLHPVCIMRGQ
jgi:hypothetical protein